MCWSKDLRGRIGRAGCVGLLSLALVTGTRARAAAEIDHDVPADVQRAVEEAFARHFVYPETNDWTFVSIEDYYGGKLVCGTVNYQNAMRKYTGAKHFYAIVAGLKVGDTAMDEDATEDVTGSAAFAMKTLCHLQ